MAGDAGAHPLARSSAGQGGRTEVRALSREDPVRRGLLIGVKLEKSPHPGFPKTKGPPSRDVTSRLRP